MRGIRWFFATSRSIGGIACVSAVGAKRTRWEAFWRSLKPCRNRVISLMLAEGVCFVFNQSFFSSYLLYLFFLLFNKTREKLRCVFFFFSSFTAVGENCYIFSFSEQTSFLRLFSQPWKFIHRKENSVDRLWTRKMYNISFSLYSGTLALGSRRGGGGGGTFLC